MTPHMLGFYRFLSILDLIWGGFWTQNRLLGYKTTSRASKNLNKCQQSCDRRNNCLKQENVTKTKKNPPLDPRADPRSVTMRGGLPYACWTQLWYFLMTSSLFYWATAKQEWASRIPSRNGLFKIVQDCSRFFFTFWAPFSTIFDVFSVFVSGFVF